MKFCYIDESGTGDEPFAVMAGIMVDALRMRPTKNDWKDLLDHLRDISGRQIRELHTRDFYSGSGPWRGIDGPERAAIITAVFEWLSDRKHKVVYSAIDKSVFPETTCRGGRCVETIWRCLGFHLSLSIQKNNQREPKNKGNTVLIFDNEQREQARFTDLLLNPPECSDTYYERQRRQDQLDQIIDAPYFADSSDVPLLQVADFVAYFLRRYCELENGGVERYAGERGQVSQWVDLALQQSLSGSMIYPRRNRCECADFFYNLAPTCLR